MVVSNVEDIWSSLLSLCRSTREQSIYVHPLSKSKSLMNQRNLEMCTENLGNENGSYILDIDYLSYTSDTSENIVRERLLPRRTSSFNSENSREFPPPLTTISGRESFQLKSFRENGRLVLKSSTVPFPSPCFASERSNGCLKLWFSETYCDVNVDEEKEIVQEEDYEEGGEEPEEPSNYEKETEILTKLEVLEAKEENMKWVGFEGIRKDENRKWIEFQSFHDRDDKKNKILGRREKILGEFHRHSKCKEGGGESLRISKQFWVATT